MDPDREEFADEVLRHGIFDHPDDANRAIESVLAELGACLVPDEAQALAAALPGSFGRIIQAGSAESSPDALFQRVSKRANMPLSRAAEMTQIVLEVLAERLAVDTLERLVKHLGPSMSILFTPRPALEEPPAHVHSPEPSELGMGHTLATGRPGSRHPLSESRPEQAHGHSVARSDNPHEDTKLSSSIGMTQEREHETLAEGRPGPKRPISESD